MKIPRDREAVGGEKPLCGFLRKSKGLGAASRRAAPSPQGRLARIASGFFLVLLRLMKIPRDRLAVGGEKPPCGFLRKFAGLGEGEWRAAPSPQGRLARIASGFFLVLLRLMKIPRDCEAVGGGKPLRGFFMIFLAFRV